MIKVLTVSTYSPGSRGFGGISTSVGHYLSALERLQIESSYFGSAGTLGGSLSKEYLSGKYRKTRVFLYAPSMHKKWGIGVGAFRLFYHVIRNEYIFIHGARTFITVLCGLISRLCRKRYAVVAHAALDRQRMNRTRQKHPILFPITEPFVRAAILGAESLIVSGPLEKTAIGEAYLRKNLVEIENFFNFKLPYQEPVYFNISHYYTFVGRFESDKGILAFMKVWKDVAKPNSKLTLVGMGQGSYANSVIEEAKTDTRIDLVGEVNSESVKDILIRSHVLVLPTGLDAPVTENFGNVVAESLSCSRPALVTKGLHWDKYEKYPCILRFPPDVEGVRRAIVEFEEMDEKYYNQLCHEAYLLSAKFSIDDAVPKLENILARG